ncbi:hypothetical protein LPJ66_003103 [Kickxella alabastrina]|uniref:Uncharacterized protein n=1 Tax=Kickxella alabastrina TaxID=61397 RepID=A0ACC1ILK1_9FUNG|nr:hypothetical protein LPJ66_003103 [Kickxella alabastrina]
MFACIRSGPLRSLSASASSSSLVRSFHIGCVIRDSEKTNAPTKGKKAEPTAAIEEDEDLNLANEPQILRAEPIQAMLNTDDEPKRVKPERSLGYKGWLITEGGAFKNTRSGRTNYIGGINKPFPLNPYFRPRAPIPDAKKEALYAEYLQAPEKNTPRVLGEKYSISLKRVEAILKLKAIEHHMVEYGEIVAQKKFTAGMESMLGVSPAARTLTENLVSQVTRVSSPRFHAVPEGQSFTAADAAEVLGRKPYQQIMDRMAASKPYVIDYEGLDVRFAPRPQKSLSKSEAAKLESLGHAEEQIVDKDETLGSRRWKFVFTDISKTQDMKDREVLIRETDGTLKKAGREYKLKRYGQLWQH